MVKYRGSECQVRLAPNGTTALGTIAPLDCVTTIEWDPNRETHHAPNGIGHYSQTTHAGLFAPSGRLERYYDGQQIEGSSIPKLLQADGTADLTNMYVKVSVGGTASGSTYYILNGCIGNAPDRLDLDGYLMETWDFKFETITISTEA